VQRSRVGGAEGVIFVENDGADGWFCRQRRTDQGRKREKCWDGAVWEERWGIVEEVANGEASGREVGEEGHRGEKGGGERPERR